MNKITESLETLHNKRLYKIKFKEEKTIKIDGKEFY